MYEPPEHSVSTLRASISNPVTRKCCSLKSSASGSPTYPIPITPTRALRVLMRLMNRSSIAIEAEILETVFELMGGDSIHALRQSFCKRLKIACALMVLGVYALVRINDDAGCGPDHGFKTSRVKPPDPCNSG